MRLPPSYGAASPSTTIERTAQRNNARMYHAVILLQMLAHLVLVCFILSRHLMSSQFIPTFVGVLLVNVPQPASVPGQRHFAEGVPPHTVE